MTMRKTLISAALGLAALASGPTIGLAADDYLKMPWDKVVEGGGRAHLLRLVGRGILATAAKDFEANTASR